MKLAIHHRKGSFSDRWIQYCEDHQVTYKLVNCSQSSIVEQLAECDGLMWNWNLTDFRNRLICRQLCSSLEVTGKKMFPDYKTSWHYDDKVGQKYLLESINAPLVPSYIFYNKLDALKWIRNTRFPKVFKLRCGAGSLNVKLASSRKEAIRLTSIAFGKGFNPVSSYSNDFKTKTRRITSLKALLQKLKRLPASLQAIRESNRYTGTERGYVYFQDFIPSNNFDIRIIVIGKRAFGIKRMVRAGDFRASGSGNIIFDSEQIDIRCVKLSFDTAFKLGSQCIAFDYIFYNEQPLIVEISYDFAIKAYDPCPGFWDQELCWHAGSFNPQYFMVEDFIESLSNTTDTNLSSIIDHPNYSVFTQLA